MALKSGSNGQVQEEAGIGSYQREGHRLVGHIDGPRKKKSQSQISYFFLQRFTVKRPELRN
jgi:hypothetical protein